MNGARQLERRESENGRRGSTRIAPSFNLTLKSEGNDLESIVGFTTSANEGGVSCKVAQQLPLLGLKTSVEINTDDGQTMNFIGSVVWVSETRKECGIRFNQTDPGWPELINRLVKDARLVIKNERRTGPRRTSELPIDRRKHERRYSELLRELYEDNPVHEAPKIKAFLRSKSATFTDQMIKDRREWLAQISKTKLTHIACFEEEASDFKGKIENPIGVAHIPLGVAGPIRINGEHAKGSFFVPLATTEGALITSYTLGSYVITRSGGTNVKILRDELKIGPMFVLRSLREAQMFVRWIDNNFTQIKEIAEKTSHHLRLLEITTIVNGRRVIANFHYHTGDAMGMNMACKATDVACKFICSSIQPEEFWLRSNFNANKKATAANFLNGYGKTVTADVTIPRKLLTLLDTTPEEMERYFFRTLLASAHAGAIGANGHFANAVAAIFIACGQDVASTANSHVGISTCEVNKSGDLYFSVYLSNILVGTVGGGTGFGTGKECLEMIGCFGTGKASKFAEIVAALALAGEIAICAAIVNGTYVYAHEAFGRNRPQS